jgi:hypothetical protein
MTLGPLKDLWCYGSFGKLSLIFPHLCYTKKSEQKTPKVIGRVKCTPVWSYMLQISKWLCNLIWVPS